MKFESGVTNEAIRSKYNTACCHVSITVKTARYLAAKTKRVCKPAHLIKYVLLI